MRHRLDPLPVAQQEMLDDGDQRVEPYKSDAEEHVFHLRLSALRLNQGDKSSRISGPYQGLVFPFRREVRSDSQCTRILNH